MIFFIGADHYDDLFADEQENTRNTWLIYDGNVVVRHGANEIENDLLLSELGDETGQKQVKLQGKNYLLTQEIDKTGFLMLHCNR